MAKSRFHTAGLVVAVAFAGLVAASAASAASVLQAEREAAEAFEQAREALGSARWDRAEILLERVLMLWPEHAEARIELARLMARRGQWEAARELIDSLADDPRTPEDFRQRLRTLAAGLAPAARPGQAPAGAAAQAANGRVNARRPWRAEVNLTASTNPLARTAATDLTLTSVDGSVTLPLAQKAVAGGLAGVTLAHVQPEWGLEATAQKLSQEEGSAAWRVTAWGPLGWSSLGRGLPARHVIQWGLQAQQGLDGLRRMAASVAWSAPQSRFSLARYAEPSQADQGWVLRWDHRLPLPTAVQGLASLERSLGAAPASTDSTARRQGHWRLSLAAEMPLGGNRRLQAQWAAQQDSSPYSPLLENNAIRWLSTATVAVEQQWDWGGGMGLGLRAYAGTRRSNLVLFSYREAGVQATVMRAW